MRGAFRNHVQRWLAPLLAVLPATGITVWLAVSGEAAENWIAHVPVTTFDAVESPEAVPASPIARPRIHPVPVVEPGGLMGSIEDPRALPDTIGVILERRLAGPATTVEDYLLWLPPGLERSDRKWPVILYLHGHSLRGDDPSMLLRYGLPRYLGEGRSIPFIVVAPQLQLPGRWTDVDRLAELLDEIEARYPVDRDRVYLTGYSMGGGGVWRMAFAHADRFAAAIPFAAHTPTPSADWTRALARLPMLVFHGTADELAPVTAAKVMVEALRRIGADIELRLVEGADHGDLTTVYGEASLYAWMLEHRRGG